MRCEECGHNISGLADDAPCTECGVVTPVERREALPLDMLRVVLGFAWPYMVIAGTLLLMRVSWAFGQDSATYIVSLAILTAVVSLLVVPINAARRTVVLMKRLPRRVHQAPLLALIPRSVMVPLLVSAASIFLGFVVVIGGCLVTGTGIRS
jgi:hypothetical protein